MRIAIVDDREDDRNCLIACLKNFSYDENLEIKIESYTSGEDFLEDENFSALDVVFLDIYMGSKSGMDVAKILREKGYQGIIVFCTTTTDYALEGYSVKAIGYILKPFTYEKIEGLLQDIVKTLGENTLYIRVKDGRQWYKINLYDILYAENQANYVHIHVLGKIYSTRMALREMEKVLLQYPCFVKCDRGIVVNMLNIREIKDNVILMNNDDRLPISRRNIPMLKERYFKFVFEELEGTRFRPSQM